jgi:hypothetical protein
LDIASISFFLFLWEGRLGKIYPATGRLVVLLSIYFTLNKFRASKLTLKKGKKQNHQAEIGNGSGDVRTLLNAYHT